MKLIKETDRLVGRIAGYKGVCDGCNIDLEYSDDLVVIEIDKTEDVLLLCPKDTLVCPNCYREISLLRLYSNLEISKELEAIKK